MNKDEIKGRSKEVQGEVKKETGKAFGDKTLEEKGRLQKNVGKAQVRYGSLKGGSKTDR